MPSQRSQMVDPVSNRRSLQVYFHWHQDRCKTLAIGQDALRAANSESNLWLSIMTGHWKKKKSWIKCTHPSNFNRMQAVIHACTKRSTTSNRSWTRKSLKLVRWAGASVALAMRLSTHWRQLTISDRLLCARLHFLALSLWPRLCLSSSCTPSIM